MIFNGVSNLSANVNVYIFKCVLNYLAVSLASLSSCSQDAELLLLLTGTGRVNWLDCKLLLPPVKCRFYPWCLEVVLTLRRLMFDAVHCPAANVSSTQLFVRLLPSLPSSFLHPRKQSAGFLLLDSLQMSTLFERVHLLPAASGTKTVCFEFRSISLISLCLF